MEETTELTVTPAPILEKVARIAELKKALAPLAALKDEIEELKAEVQLEMQRSGSKRTEAAGGYFLVRAETTSYVIDDETKLADWLDENVLEPTVFYKIDAKSITKLAEERLETDGEILPGVKKVTTESISVRSAKQ